MRLTKLLALVAFALCMGVSGAFATVILPNGNLAGAGTDFTGTIGPELAGDPTIMYNGVQLKDVNGNVVGTGNLEVGVAADATLGFIDFLYQYKSLTGDLGDLSVSSFTGFSTDVGYATALAGWDAVVGNLPSSITRGASGSNVDFVYSPNLSAIAETPVLVVRVLASKAFLVGNTAIQEGGNANESSYAPTPEPTFYGLIAVGLLGVIGVSRRRKVSQPIN